MDGMLVSRCVFLLMFWNQYLDSRMSLFIFRIIGFVMLLLCQCIFDNKSLTKTAFPLLFAHVLAVPSGDQQYFGVVPMEPSLPAERGPRHHTTSTSLLLIAHSVFFR